MESGLVERDFDKAIISFAEKLLTSHSYLVEGEKIHVKNNYVKITPKAAALVYACLFISTYNLAGARAIHREVLNRILFYLGLRFKDPKAYLMAALEEVMPCFVKYLV